MFEVGWWWDWYRVFMKIVWVIRKENYGYYRGVGVVYIVGW